MAVIKNISVTIYQYKEGKAFEIFTSTAYHTEEFPHQHVQRVMEFVTGYECDNDDHGCLNNLQVNGKCGFKFGDGVDWPYYVEAYVNYPK
jgi:hypothetical protein